MACIDKTYLADYNVYQQFIEWAKNTTFVCPNGVKLNVIDSVYDYWSKEDMNERERPVLNSSHTLDYFLIKYCPFDFVQERMKGVYSEDFYESVKNGTSDYDTFVYPPIATKFVVVRGKHMKHKNYLWKLRQRKILFDIDVEYKDSLLWYNDEIHRFLLPSELGEMTQSFAYKARTIKALIRHLKKMKLPKGAIITARGRYIGEDLLILAK